MLDIFVYVYYVFVNKLIIFSDVVIRKSGLVLLLYVLYCSVDKIGYYFVEINNEIYINYNGKFICNGMWLFRNCLNFNILMIWKYVYVFVKYRVLWWKIKDNFFEWFNKLLYFVLKIIRNKLLGKVSVKLSLNIVRIIELYLEFDFLKD